MGINKKVKEILSKPVEMKPTISELIKQPYKIIIQQDTDGCFYAKVEEMEGCFAEGQTAGEAWENIHDSMKNWMEIAQEMNVSIPLPKADQETEYSGKYLLRMPKKLHKELTETSEEEGISLNLLLVNLLSSRLPIHRIEKKIADLCDASNSLQQKVGWIMNQQGKQDAIVTTGHYGFTRSKKPIILHDSVYTSDMWGEVKNEPK